MKEVEDLLKKIEGLRKELNDIIGTKGDLLDIEVIEVSRLLDKRLVEYHRLLRDRTEQYTGLSANDSAYAPIRAIAEAMGEEVQWDSPNRTVVVNSSGKLAPDGLKTR